MNLEIIFVTASEKFLRPMQSYRSSILPVVAIVLAFLAMTYSACHESIAESNPVSADSSNGQAELKKEISRFESSLKELQLIHDGHIKSYSDEMGCVRDSKALEIIKHHNELLATHKDELASFKLRIIMGGSDAEKNKADLQELKKDFDQLQIDGVEIRTGLENIAPLNITK